MSVFYVTGPTAARWVYGFRPVEFNGGRRLPVDVHADDEAFVITAAVPGLKADDLKIEVQDDVVTLRGKVGGAETDEDGYLLREVARGEFERSLRLPDPVDAAKAEASIENGLLRVRIPKAEEAKPKTISIKTR